MRPFSRPYSFYLFGEFHVNTFVAIRSLFSFYFSGPEVLFSAEQQLEAAGGIDSTTFATVRVTVDEHGQSIVEAFQVSFKKKSLGYFGVSMMMMRVSDRSGQSM